MRANNAQRKKESECGGGHKRGLVPRSLRGKRRSQLISLVGHISLRQDLISPPLYILLWEFGLFLQVRNCVLWFFNSHSQFSGKGNLDIGLFPARKFPFSEYRWPNVVRTKGDLRSPSPRRIRSKRVQICHIGSFLFPPLGRERERARGERGKGEGGVLGPPSNLLPPLFPDSILVRDSSIFSREDFPPQVEYTWLNPFLLSNCISGCGLPLVGRRTRNVAQKNLSANAKRRGERSYTRYTVLSLLLHHSWRSDLHDQRGGTGKKDMKHSS